MRRLVIRPGAIGDVILSLPALESLCADYTEFWVPEPVTPLVRLGDAVRSIGSTGLDLLEIFAGQAPPPLLEALRSFDDIISWYGSNREQFRSVVRAMGLPFHHLRALPPDGARHAIDYYLAQVQPFALSLVEPAPIIDCPAAAGGCVVIHPFSGSRLKNWPLERFQELARRLPAEFEVFWCAGPEEELPEARRFDNLYDLACWLAGARLYIGNDSGITHLAAAVGAPVVAIFGPTDPRVWAPRGSRVKVVAAALAGGPVESVSLDRVALAADELLSLPRR